MFKSIIINHRFLVRAVITGLISLLCWLVNGSLILAQAQAPQTPEGAYSGVAEIEGNPIQADVTPTPVLPLPKPAAGSASVDGWALVATQEFEGVFPGSGLGWSVLDLSNDGYDRKWDDDNYKQHDGYWAAWPARGGVNGSDPTPGNDQYYPNMETRMIYGPFDLSDASYADTDFYLWRNMEECCDYIAFEISLDGSNYTELARWTGTYDWEFKDIYFNDYAGYNRVWVAWRFHSDASVQKVGPWVDDIRVWKYVPPQPTSTPTRTQTPNRTFTPTSTYTLIPTETPTATNTPTWTPTRTVTPTRTRTPADTKTSTVTHTPANTSTPTPTYTNTPQPFLYSPFLGEAIRGVSSIFDHTDPLFTRQDSNNLHRITCYNGSVADCPTNTPTPIGFTLPGNTPTPRCRSGAIYHGISYEGHNGIDYAIHYQPVVAAATTVAVEYAGWQYPSNRKGGYGLYVVLRHDNDYRTFYGHLTSIMVQACEVCSYPQGTIIGISGNTGSSTGPHLHFSVLNGPSDPPNGEIQEAVVDPYGWLPTQAPAWENNQRNSLWVSYPHAGSTPYIVPGGTATPWPGLPSTQYVVDDDPTNIYPSSTSCSWYQISNQEAEGGNMHAILPTYNGSATCFLRWPRPGNLPSGRYQLYVRVPIVYAWGDTYTEGAIYKIHHADQSHPGDFIVDQTVVSQQEVLNAGANLYPDDQVYIGTFYFAGGEAAEYVELGNVVIFAVGAGTRLVADSLTFGLEQLITPVPTPTGYRLYFPLMAGTGDGGDPYPASSDGEK